MSSFIVRRMAFFNSTSAKSGWYHIVIPTNYPYENLCKNYFWTAEKNCLKSEK